MTDAWLDEAEDEQRRVRQAAARTLLQVRGLSPEAAAQADRSAQVLGLPPMAVAIDPRLNADARSQQNLSALEGSPRTARFLADEDNARVASDQVDSLSTLEALSQHHRDTWARNRTADPSRLSYLQRLAGVFGGGGYYGMGARAQALNLPGATGDVLRRVPGGFGEALGTIVRGGGRAGARTFDETPLEGVFENMASAGERIQIGGRNVGGNLRPNEARAYANPINRGILLEQAQTETGFVGEVAGGVGQIMAQATIAVATAGTATLPALGLQGVGSMDERVQADMRREGRTEYTLQDDLALIGGGIITAASEKVGLDAVLGRLPAPIKQRITNKLTDIFLAGAIEGSSELVEGIGQNALAKYLLGEDTGFLDGAAEGGQVGFTVGALARAALLTALPGRQGASTPTPREQAAADASAFDDLVAAVNENPLRERAPERFRQFLESVTGDQTVTVPAERMRSFFQSNPDLEMWLDEWDIRDQYNEALVSNADITMSRGTYLARVAPTQAHTYFRDDLRLGDGALTLREAEDMEASGVERLEAAVEQARTRSEEAVAQATPGQAVFDDVFNQLRGAGFTEPVARQYATVWRSRAETRAARLPELYPDALTAYQAEPLTITQTLPETLRSNPDRLDVMIEALRKGTGAPSQRALRGSSLLEFVSSNGGIVDTGGELMAMGADGWHRGRRVGTRRLVQPAGETTGKLDPDYVRERAIENGYLPEGASIDDLYAAMREELAGRPVFSGDVDFDVTAEGNAEALDDLERALSSLGIDPKQATNEEIKGALDKLAAEPEGEPLAGYDQAGRAVTDSPAFREWFGNSVVVDADGKPLVVYRGQHSGEGELQSRLPSLTFSTADAASTYATIPNNRADTPAAPVVFPSYLSIQKPIINDPDDPYIDLSVIEDALGRDTVIALARSQASDLEQTGAWEDGFSQEFADIDDVIERAPERLGELPVLAFKVLDDPELVERLRAAGFDGAVHAGVGQTFESPEYRVFGEAQVQSVFSRSYDQSAPPVTASPAFTRWFRDSKAVDASGQPLVVYHGTNQPIDEFSAERLGRATGDNAGAGRAFFFTADPAIASVYAENAGKVVVADVASYEARVAGFQRDILAAERRGDWDTAERLQSEWEDLDADAVRGDDVTGQNVVPVYLSLQNPLEIDYEGERPTDLDERVAEAQEAGHDGLILRNVDDTPGETRVSDQFVVFAPTQIKSSLNRGSFDPSDSRILYQGPVPDPIDALTTHKQGAQNGSIDGFTDLARLDGGGVVEDLYTALTKAETAEAAFKAADGWALARGRRTGVEHLVAFDEAGGLMLAGRGTASHVAFPRYFQDRLNAGQVRYMTHNHPSNSGLSIPDLIGMLVGSLQGREKGGVQMDATAMGHKGAVVSASIGPAFADKKVSEWKEIGQALAQIQGKVNLEIQRQINMSAMTLDQAHESSTHLVNMAFHRAGLIDLRSTGAEIVRSTGIDVDAFFTRVINASDVARRAGFELAAERDTPSDQGAGGLGRQEPAGDGQAGISPGMSRPVGRGRGRAAADPRQLTLFQGERGRIDFTSTGRTIRLFENRDLSTFLHESGHAFLDDIMTDAAAADAMPMGGEQLRADRDALLKWFGVDSVEGIGTEQHEQFARAVEAYFMEGRAPSLELRSAFARFKSWLVRIYRTVARLNTPINDDIRGVLDRLLATDEQIAEATTSAVHSRLFADAEAAGMTQAEFARYTALDGRAQAKAEDALLRKIMDPLRRKATKEYREEWERLRPGNEREVDALPDIAAIAYLRENKVALSREALVAMYGSDAVLKLLPQTRPLIYAKAGAMHPDALADIVGARTGEELVNLLMAYEAERVDLRAKGDKRSVRDYRVDQGTDRDYRDLWGDPLTDGRLEQEALDAVHEKQRGDAMASEVNQLAKLAGVNGLWTVEAMQDFASRTVGEQRANKLRPAAYLRAERKAGIDAQRAFAKQDFGAALDAKLQQNINFHLYRAALDAEAAVSKASDLFAKVIGGREKDIAKYRNMDIVYAARGVLDAYGVTKANQNPAEYLARMREYDPEAYAILEPYMTAALADAKPVDDLTVTEFADVAKVVDQLWKMSRRSKVVEIEGRKIEIATITAELTQTLLDSGPPRGLPGARGAVTDADKRLNGFLGLKSAITKTEEWAARKGPAFVQYIFRPVSKAADAYRASRREFIPRLLDHLKLIEKDLGKPFKIDAPELGYVFGENRGAGLAELLGALRHTGNESNLRKLLLGRQWASENPDGSLDTSRWDAFLARKHADGTLTRAHWDYVQAEWDLHEAIKPLAQKAHRAMYGRYFDEITTRPVVTPFGTYKGGYVAAKADPNIDAAAEGRAAEGLLDGRSGTFMFPGPANGFTKSRVEYNTALDLDIRLAVSQMDEVLKFAHLGPVVRDVNRILMNREFAPILRQYDPNAWLGVLLPWLERSVSQRTATPSRSAGGRFFDAVVAGIGRNTGMSIMFGSLVNTAQQVTGLSVASLRTGKRNMAHALGVYLRDPAGVTRAVRQSSQLMADRADSQMQEVADAANAIVLNPSLYEKGVRWTTQHAYFMQHGFQNVLDPIIWLAARDRGVQTGEADPEGYADMVIRTTQGTRNPEDITNFSTGPKWAAPFKAFTGYFIDQANMLETEWVKAGSVGRRAEVYALGFFVPSVIAKLIAELLSGRLVDEDDDGWGDEFLEIAVLSQIQYALAMLPILGQGANLAINRFDGKMYNDRLSVAPFVSTIEAASRVPFDFYKIVQGKGDASDTVKDVLTAVALATGLPMPSRQAGYVADVLEEDVEPTGPVDATRGFLTGSASPESRQ